MGERQPFELGKRLEELLGQPQMRRLALIMAAVDPVVEVVGGVVSAPQDAVVGGEPVVVEQVRHVAQPLTTGPADRGHLFGGERLGHQDVVVHRDRVATGGA